MTTLSPKPDKASLYPWLICGCCILLLFCTIGLGANTLPIYYPFMMKEDGFTNTQISVITTVRCAFAFISMGLTPVCIRRLGLRFLSALTCAVLALAFVILSVAHTLVPLYTAAVALGFSYGFGSMILVSVLVRNWFNQREGFALGVSACGSGLANIFCSPLITASIEKLGLALSFRLEAGLALLCGVLIYAVVRDTPQQIGVKAYGLPRPAAAASVVAPAGAAASTPVSPAGSGTKTGMSRRDQYLMMGAMLAAGPAYVTVASFYTMHYTACGYDSMVIAAAMSLFGVVLTLTKLFYGWCNDRFGVYRSNWIFFAGTCLSDLLIAFSGLFPPGCLIFIALSMSAYGYPPTMIGQSLWARDLCAPEEYTKKVSLYQQLCMVGAMAGTMLAGISADITGGYTAAYVGCFVCTLFVLLTVQYLYRRYGKR